MRLASCVLRLFLVFLFSVLIRLPNIDRPLSKHHEFCTAISLRTIQIWYENGIRQYGGNPVMTYGDTADRYINNFASGTGEMIDARGQYYYVSHPPLAYYVPFLLFRVTRIYPSVDAIQYFHLFIHFLCGLGVYWIACILLGRKLFGELSFTAFTAYTLYLFSPATLWFQCNTYMADMFVQLPFIYGILFFLIDSRRLAHHDSPLERGLRGVFAGSRMVWVEALIVFLAVYTSWLGVFFAIVLAGYYLFKLHLWRRAAGILLSMLLALALIVWQYSHINGLHAYLAEAFQRGSERSINDISKVPFLYLTVLANYIYNYLPVLGLLVVALVLTGKGIFSKLKSLAPFIIVAGLPVLLLHLILAGYSGHDFTTLYAAPFLAVLTALLMRELPVFKHYQRSLLILTVVASIFQYYYINRPGDTSQRGDKYNVDMKIGRHIGGESKPEEVVFLQGEKPNPMVVFYAHRNIQQVKNEGEAKAFLAEHQRKQGILFVMNSAGKPEIEKRLNSQ